MEETRASEKCEIHKQHGHLQFINTAYSVSMKSLSHSSKTSSNYYLERKPTGIRISGNNAEP